MERDQYIRKLRGLQKTQRRATTPQARRAAGRQIEALQETQVRQTGQSR